MKTTQLTDSLKTTETTKTYTSFQKAATTSDPVYLFQLPAKSAIISLYVQVEHAFSLPYTDCKITTTGDFLKNVDMSSRRPGDDYERNFTLSPYMHSVTSALNIYATMYSFGLGFWENYAYSLNLGRFAIGLAGTRSSALAYGGYYNATLTMTEMSADGAWAYIGDLNVARHSHGACGAGASAALAIGGNTGSSNYVNTVEKFAIGSPKQEYPGYNTGTWSTTGSLNVALSRSAALGTVNDALNIGGAGSSNYSYVQRYNGATWMVESHMLSTRYEHGVGGIPGSCIAFGGYDNSSHKSTQIYNGSVWSTGPNLMYSRNFPSGTGKTTTGGIICFGGTWSYEIGPTEEYQSSTGVWTTTNNMNIARQRAGGCGNISVGQGGAMAAGGYSYVNGTLDSCEIYTASSTTPAVLSGLTAGEATFTMKYIQYE